MNFTVPTGMEGIKHVCTFRKVVLFLLGVAESEILHAIKPLLVVWKGRAGEFKKVLLEEMKRYARQQYPFNQHIDSKQPIISWWRALEGSEFASVLPVSFSASRCTTVYLFIFIDLGNQNPCSSREFHPRRENCFVIYMDNISFTLPDVHWTDDSTYTNCSALCNRKKGECQQCIIILLYS